MSSQEDTALKQIFLYVLIGSVSISALLGIVAILVGDFGQFEIRVLLTSLTVSGASLCGLSCGAALEAQDRRALPIAGIVLALLGAALIIFGIWAELASETFWKTAATLALFAVSCSQLSLLLLARLISRYVWSRWAAAVAVFGVALIITCMLWAELDEEPAFRVLGVAAILDGAFTLLVPIFHRLGREERAARAEQAETANDAAESVTLGEVDAEIAQLQARLTELQELRNSLVARPGS